MEAFIKLNGKSYPFPARGLNLIISTLVDSGRNADGETVGQVVGRELQKIDNLYWPYLDASTWSAILQEFGDFYTKVTYPDMKTGTWTTRLMYPGDRTATPYWLDKNTGLPAYYINCKVNVIDCGAALE